MAISETPKWHSVNLSNTWGAASLWLDVTSELSLSCRHLNCQVFTCKPNLIKRSVPDKFHPRQLNCVSGVYSLPNTSDADKCCPLLFSVKQRRINLSTSHTDSLSSDQTLQTTNTGMAIRKINFG